MAAKGAFDAAPLRLLSPGRPRGPFRLRDVEHGSAERLLVKRVDQTDDGPQDLACVHELCGLEDDACVDSGIGESQEVVIVGEEEPLLFQADLQKTVVRCTGEAHTSHGADIDATVPQPSNHGSSDVLVSQQRDQRSHIPGRDPQRWASNASSRSLSSARISSGRSW